MAVREDLQRTQFLLSEDRLQHFAEYHSKLQVLKVLNYVDPNGTRKFFTVIVGLSQHQYLFFSSSNEG